MNTFKVQRIRSCTQCHEVLPLKCKKCACSPTRKPRVVELFNWPEVLKVAECGCCFQFACQLPGCTGRMWRCVKKNQKALSVSRNLYHTKICAISAAHRAKENFEMVPCEYCRKPCRRTQFMLKRHAHVFCHGECYHLWRAKKKHQAMQEKDNPQTGMLHCRKCGAVTEHQTPKVGKAKCLICETLRGQEISVSGAVR